jgi:anti-sigma regulatory factor (Ser/Thr protein kinase)
MADPIHEAVPLEGTAEDAPTARGAARAVFRRAGVGEDLAGDALLCLSELVTNALLHAGGAVCVEITATPTAVRLEVTDRMSLHHSPDLVAGAAARAALADDAIDRETGRGLGIVEQLCHTWGVTAVDVEGRPGKLVWADLIASPQTTPLTGHGHDGEPSGDGDEVDDADRDQREATLRDVPIRLYLASEAHLEALLRDMQLLAADWTSRNDPLVKGLAESLRRNSAARTASMEEVRRRIDAGDDVITLRFPVSSETPTTAATFLDVVATCEERTGRGRDTADPAAAELRHFRRWYVSELTHQANGGPPRRCPFRP